MAVRRLIIIILVIAVWFAGDRMAAGVFSSALDRSHDPIAQLYAGTGGGDIVLLGNSRAYRGFDFDFLSREFSGRVVNLALPGAPIELSEALIDDYLDRYGSPRLLILELSGLVQGPDALKEVRVFTARSKRIASLMRAHHPQLYYAGAVSHLFNFNNGFALNLADKVVRPMPDLRLTGEFSEAAAASAPDGNYFVPRSDQLVAARRLMANVQRRNVNVRYMLMPVERHYAARNQATALQTAVQGLTGGHNLWDLIDGPPVAAPYFADQVHLNRRGVTVLMNHLRTLGFFN